MNGTQIKMFCVPFICLFEDYTTYKPNRQPTEFEHDGKTYKRYLPDKVLDFFNDEFDYLELANWQALQNLAMAYFTLITSPYEVTSGGGGGDSQSDLKWGRVEKPRDFDPFGQAGFAHLWLQYD